MKIGIIGLGNIAQKAYLPVITAMENLELVLCTRNENTLNKLSKKYRIPTAVKTIDELIASGIDAAFVHTSTESHFDIVKKLLLNGINVYVDKPLSYSYDEALELADLSQKAGKILMVGFNRRFAPMYKNLKNEENPNIILIQKNRVALPNNARTFIYDDFIHVVDTMRFMMGKPFEDIHIRFLNKDDKLYNIVLELSNESTTAIGIMNRDSGASEEVVEYMCPGHKFIVKDLVSTTHLENNNKNILKFNDWDPTLYRRGFYQIVEHFLNCVKNNEMPVPSIQDSLITHEICEKLVNKLE